MQYFLDKIAERLIKKFPNNMQKVAVILPNKRAIVFLKHYLSQRISDPIFLPRFFSIEEFISHVSGLEVLDNISLQFKLYQSYLSHPPTKVDSFDDFLKSYLVPRFNSLVLSLYFVFNSTICIVFKILCNHVFHILVSNILII